MAPSLATAASPRAIAIILGPLGASSTAMERYASWYQQERRGCKVVQGVSPPMRFLRNASLQPTAIALWKQTLQVVRDSPPTVPVVVHMFSNGGCFLWDSMGRLLTSNDETELSADEKEMLQSRLSSGYLLFDSCPCYIRTLWDTSTPWSASFPYPGWSPWGQALYTALAATSLSVWLVGTLSWSKPQQFWQQMTESKLCNHHIYVYTTTDLASDATAVDRIVQQRRQANEGTTQQYRYNDSNHTRIDKDHPEEYQRMIDDALDAAVARAVATVAQDTDQHK